LPGAAVRPDRTREPLRRRRRVAGFLERGAQPAGRGGDGLDRLVDDGAGAEELVGDPLEDEVFDVIASLLEGVGVLPPPGRPAGSTSAAMIVAGGRPLRSAASSGEANGEDGSGA
jgi:hypothetical protein